MCHLLLSKMFETRLCFQSDQSVSFSRSVSPAAVREADEVSSQTGIHLDAAAAGSLFGYNSINSTSCFTVWSLKSFLKCCFVFVGSCTLDMGRGLQALKTVKVMMVSNGIELHRNLHSEATYLLKIVAGVRRVKCFSQIPPNRWLTFLNP